MTLAKSDAPSDTPQPTAEEIARRKRTYVVAASKVWRSASGRTVSVHGALPWHGDAQKAAEGWELVTLGWTVHNEIEGTFGIGRLPWESREAAQAWINGTGPIAETFEQRRDRLAVAGGAK